MRKLHKVYHLFLLKESGTTNWTHVRVLGKTKYPEFVAKAKEVEAEVDKEADLVEEEKEDVEKEKEPVEEKKPYEKHVPVVKREIVEGETIFESPAKRLRKASSVDSIGPDVAVVEDSCITSPAGKQLALAASLNNDRKHGASCESYQPRGK